MALPHPERHRWVKVISSINRKINDGAEPKKKSSGSFSIGTKGINYVAPDEDD